MEKPKVVIYLEGGLVQEIISDQELEVVVVDFDTEGNDDHPCVVPWKDEEAARDYTAFVNKWSVGAAKKAADVAGIETAFRSLEVVRANYKAQKMKNPF